MKHPKDPRTNRPKNPAPPKKTRSVTALESRVDGPDRRVGSPQGPPMPTIKRGPGCNLAMFDES